MNAYVTPVWALRLTVVLIAWGVLAFGAVYEWAYWPLAAACAVVGLVGLLSGWATATASRGLLAASVAFGFAVLVQLVPLRTSVIGSISSSTAALLSDLLPGCLSSQLRHGFSNKRVERQALIFINNLLKLTL